MTDAERAARTMLGDLDEPDKDLRDLLGELLAHERRLSDGERIVVDVALQFWNGGGTATIANALKWFDQTNLLNFLRALAILRPDVTAAAARTIS